MKRIFSFLALLLVVASCQKEQLVDISTNATSEIDFRSTGADGTFILIAKNENLSQNLLSEIAALGGVVKDSYPKIGVMVVEAPGEGFQASAKRLSEVFAVVPNVMLEWSDPTLRNGEAVTQAVSPPFSGDDDFFFDLQWGHDAIDAPEAWEAGYRGAGVRVAILDGGFDLDHPDLAPNINLGLSANFVPGEDLQYGLPGPFSHGTHVAGTVAAADNGFGVIGVAPEAELVLVKVLGDGGSGAFSWVLSGILHAADVGADVINMSLGADIPQGTGLGSSEVAALRAAHNRALNYAYQSGATIIVAAGNDARDGDHDKSMVVFPADIPHAISISATAPQGWAVDPANTFLDNPASYTNYGQSAIDFAAPGGDYSYAFQDPSSLCTVAGLTRPCYVFDYVFSTGNGGWYWSVGTSMAAPHAAGVAALIIGKNGGDMPPAQVKAAMRRSAEDLGKPGKDDFYGSGRVNAYQAVVQ